MAGFKQQVIEIAYWVPVVIDQGVPDSRDINSSEDGKEEQEEEKTR